MNHLEPPSRMKSMNKKYQIWWLYFKTHTHIYIYIYIYISHSIPIKYIWSSHINPHGTHPYHPTFPKAPRPAAQFTANPSPKVADAADASPTITGDHGKHHPRGIPSGKHTQSYWKKWFSSWIYPLITWWCSMGFCMFARGYPINPK